MDLIFAVRGREPLAGIPINTDGYDDGNERETALEIKSWIEEDIE